MIGSCRPALAHANLICKNRWFIPQRSWPGPVESVSPRSAKEDSILELDAVPLVGLGLASG
jgi:hypothetical protein